ncbi:exopolyphosphatase-related protein [Salinispira pacifica]|uniref:Exopolyphosphatase-related protein n=1 Tax=Salinispira pacifica TaxID=1307761 RepID=V5WJM8_9SPIO|nr:exopolyphosphatase-related protein [Salinispira pacifica]AHC15774.1 Exopolyphosphatase-related protein [Salinispira pacifica]
MPDVNPDSYRLITRSDFDGLVCAVLLKEQENIEEIQFVHPKDMQDGLIEIHGNDLTANLPYVNGVYRAFDHHFSETIRNKGKADNHIIDPDAPSAARVIYNFYGGEESFPNVSPDMMDAVDKGDSASFNIEEVLNPREWVLLNFIMDARTGLGRFRNFRISNYQLMMDLIEYCRDHSITEILELPDVKERVDLYFEHQDAFRRQIRENSRVDGDILIVSLLDAEPIYAGNRFVKYALYPETSVSIQQIWGYNRENIVFTVGRSIFNKISQVNIGELMLEYGGGGHAAAGTCQVESDRADEVLQELLRRLKD